MALTLVEASKLSNDTLLSGVIETIAQESPSSTSQKYSNELKRSAKSASAGADTISTAVPNSPPIAENTSPAPSASSA